MGIVSKTLDLVSSQVPTQAVDQLLGTSGSKYKLRMCTFGELKCHKTEDWTGADETQLRIWIDDALSNVDDGTLLRLRDFLGVVGSGVNMVISLPTSTSAYVFRRDMNDGHKAHIGLTVPVLPGRRIRLQLQDLDGGIGDPHDTLGDVSTTVRPEPASDVLDADGDPKFKDIPFGGMAPDGDIDFTGDDAHYSLKYHITEVTLTEPPTGSPTGPGGFKLPVPKKALPLPDTGDVQVPDLPIIGKVLTGLQAPTQVVSGRALAPARRKIVVPSVRTKVR